MSYYKHRYLHKYVSIDGTRPQQTSSIDTELQTCALPGTCSNQDVKQLRSREAYYTYLVTCQIPHYLPLWWDRKITKAKLLATIMLYGSRQHQLAIF